MARGVAPPLTVLVLPAMNVSDPELPETVELPDNAFHLGRDGEGADHYATTDRRVFVVRHDADGDVLEREETIAPKSLQEWMDYVRDRRGWLVEKYDDRPTLEWILEPRVPQEDSQGVSA